jgi:hypothetical protein
MISSRLPYLRRFLRPPAGRFDGRFFLSFTLWESSLAQDYPKRGYVGYRKRILIW